MATYEPVRTLADLMTLDSDEIVAGYLEAQPGDPEPGPNRSRAYWHGWRNRMCDRGKIEMDGAMSQLAYEVVRGSTSRLRKAGRQD